MSFDEVRFPVNISIGATGGPTRRTEVVTLGSGFEERNALWANSRRRYNAGYGAKTIDLIHAVIEFWEARNGRLIGFRWKDWSDYKSVAPLVAVQPGDQAIGAGTGALATFQLVKTYTSGGRSFVRTIAKPVAGSVRVAVAGVEKTITTQWTIDTATGIVTFTGGNIPTLGQAVTAGFEFDVPVRFDMDELSISIPDIRAGQIADIPIVEIRI